MKFGAVKQQDGSVTVVVPASRDSVAPVPGYHDLAEVIEDPGRAGAASEALRSGARWPEADARWLPPLRRPGRSSAWP